MNVLQWVLLFRAVFSAVKSKDFFSSMLLPFHSALKLRAVL